MFHNHQHSLPAHHTRKNPDVFIVGNLTRKYYDDAAEIMSLQQGCYNRQRDWFNDYFELDYDSRYLSISASSVKDGLLAVYAFRRTPSINKYWSPWNDNKPRLCITIKGSVLVKKITMDVKNVDKIIVKCGTVTKAVVCGPKMDWTTVCIMMTDTCLAGKIIISFEASSDVNLIMVKNLFVTVATKPNRKPITISLDCTIQDKTQSYNVFFSPIYFSCGRGSVINIITINIVLIGISVVCLHSIVVITFNIDFVDGAPISINIGSISSIGVDIRNSRSISIGIGSIRSISIDIGSFGSINIHFFSRIYCFPLHIILATPAPITCHFDMQQFTLNYGGEPPYDLRVVGSDDDSEEFNPSTDLLEEGVVLYVDCSQCVCTETGLKCVYTPCEPWGSWSPWSPCVYDNGHCHPGIKIKVKICALPFTPCPGDHRLTQMCPPPDSCHATPPTCDAPMVFVQCMTCQRTCYHVRNSRMTCEEPEGCMSGCVCPEGMVMYQGRCIEEDQCPCIYNGDIVAVGEVVPGSTECEECTCTVNNEMECHAKEDCCSYGDWGTWTDCSMECGGGTQMRSRSLISGGESCYDGKTETRMCNIFECPKPCEYHGVQYGANELVPGYSDNPCLHCFCQKDGESYSIQCMPNPDCVVDGGWSDWSEWGDCSQSCGGGYKIAFRDCTKPEPKCGGDQCSGACSKTIPCNEDIPCCAVTQWSCWSDCSVTCEEGTMTRHRHLINPMENCPDVELEQEKDCNYGECPDCDLTVWQVWSECHSDTGCGMGHMHRTMVIPDSCPPGVVAPIQTVECYVGDCDCPPGQVYTNYSTMVKTCDSRDHPLDPSDCEYAPGCACPDNMYYDPRDDSCKTEDECDSCNVNGTIYQNMENFQHPYHPCMNCHCYRGEWEDSCKPCDCHMAPCPAGTVAKTMEGECCPTCVPIQDTCKIYNKFDYLTDISGRCKSKYKERYSVCAGSCGNSRTDVFLLKPYGGNMLGNTRTECSCCNAVLREDEPQEIEVTCEKPNGEMFDGKATYYPIERCECRHCSGDDDDHSHPPATNGP
ncbi:hypothetical protein ScPMuIL_015576 [Solemya velum]